MDAIAILGWIAATRAQTGKKVEVILFGHSIGAGVASFAAASNTSSDLKIIGLILETPFTSVADMLRILYPRRWLPYYYLTPFLRSSWDLRQYLSQIARQPQRPRIMIVQAESDEIVNKEMAPEIKDIAVRNKFTVDFFTVRGALHFECMGHGGFPEWVSVFVANCMNR